MNRLTKYAAFAAISARHARRARAEVIARIVFFGVVLGVFSSLWRAVAEAGMPVAADPRTLVWYLAITEWIVLSAPLVHFDIQEAVRRGDVVCQLGRPVSYVGAMVAEGLGTLSVRGPILLVTAWVCAVAYTRWVPPLADIAIVVPFGIAAAAILTAIHVGLGLVAFWLGDVSPLSWILQKLLFVLGGLLMPLPLYPVVVQRIAPFTPFPTLLAGPATLLLHQGVSPAALTLRMAVWACLVGVMLWQLFSRVSKGLSVTGG